MKIGNTTSPVATGQVGGAAAAPREASEAAKGGSTRGTQGTEGSTTVKLSSAATALLDGADGGFDAEKVQRVRQSISDGTYKVNADAIADKLIANAQEVLGKIDASR
ncbi:FlgM family anti-sigma-28 factor [Sphaerotilus hippei]|uniref:Negative regulator of flagellin synthesis n=1 Tax=Sphaerotilus hippei TaxID=744406 RepID=A0A318GYF8_9BURK|nr:flagellar biosynthesis anti-sigma factor FlgM [Sphaerotilus hippei]PXW93699.1 FlgM family anti-sigma-28 factor [Sphaerotilus hippei]